MPNSIPAQEKRTQDKTTEIDTSESLLKRVVRVSWLQNGIYDYSLLFRPISGREASLRPLPRWSTILGAGTVGFSVGQNWINGDVVVTANPPEFGNFETESTDYTNTFIAAELIQSLSNSGGFITYLGIGIGAFEKRVVLVKHLPEKYPAYEVNEFSGIGPVAYLGLRASVLHLGVDAQLGLEPVHNGSQRYLRLGVNMSADINDKIVNRIWIGTGVTFLVLMMYLMFNPLGPLYG